jgi:coenzyme PQQ precursor peptide PqqA
MDGTGYPVRVLSGCGQRRISTDAATEKVRKMAWTTPTLVEICIGLEINGYLPPEF